MPKLIELTATYMRQRFRFENASGDVIIGDAMVQTANGNETIKIKGNVDGEDDQEEPAPHGTYRFYGQWTTYREERQFAYKTFVRVAPHTRAGIIKYLQRAPGIGPVTAGILHDRFRHDAVRVLRETPDVAAAAVPRLDDEAAQLASLFLQRDAASEGAMIELIELLDGRGFWKDTAKWAIKVFGTGAAEIIKRDAFKLLGAPGAGFKKCDALYLSLGGNPASMKRQALCAWYAVAQATSQTGNTWHYVGVAEKALTGTIGGAKVNLKKAIALAKRARLLAARWTDGVNGPLDSDGDIQWLATRAARIAESRVADSVNTAMADRGWPSIILQAGLITDHQSAKLLDATAFGCLGLLIGTPGSGKTFAAASFINDLGIVYGYQSIAVCAPTGKAAVRISTALAERRIPLRATTIHSLLQVQSADEGGWSFLHDSFNPLPHRFIIVDEASMIDAPLMASLLSARARGACVLLIGDPNQLPPVGHGAPLRDMIVAGVPCGELTEIHRNAGAIARICKAIKEEKPWEPAKVADLVGGNNLILAEARTPAAQSNKILELLDGTHRYDVDPVWQSQVVVAVNKNSEVSRKNLNIVLQKHLNPSPPVDRSPFRLNDKVVNTKNRWYPAATGSKYPAPPKDQVNNKGQVFVANGDVARIEAIAPKYFDVQLISRPDLYVRVPLGGRDAEDDEGEDATGTGCDWDLAYAMTTHKLQGSEADIVIVVIDEHNGARRLCDRGWFYTAISRGKKLTYIVGQLATAKSFCAKNNMDSRKTFLNQLIQGD